MTIVHVFVISTFVETEIGFIGIIKLDIIFCDSLYVFGSDMPFVVLNEINNCFHLSVDGFVKRDMMNKWTYNEVHIS